MTTPTTAPLFAQLLSTPIVTTSSHPDPATAATHACWPAPPSSARQPFSPPLKSFRQHLPARPTLSHQLHGPECPQVLKHFTVSASRQLVAPFVGQDVPVLAVPVAQRHVLSAPHTASAELVAAVASTLPRTSQLTVHGLQAPCFKKNDPVHEAHSPLSLRASARSCRSTLTPPSFAPDSQLATPLCESALLGPTPPSSPDVTPGTLALGAGETLRSNTAAEDRVAFAAAAAPSPALFPPATPPAPAGTVCVASALSGAARWWLACPNSGGAPCALPFRSGSPGTGRGGSGGRGGSLPRALEKVAVAAETSSSVSFATAPSKPPGAAEDHGGSVTVVLVAAGLRTLPPPPPPPPPPPRSPRQTVASTAWAAWAAAPSCRIVLCLAVFTLSQKFIASSLMGLTAMVLGLELFTLVFTWLGGAVTGPPGAAPREKVAAPPSTPPPPPPPRKELSAAVAEPPSTMLGF